MTTLLPAERALRADPLPPARTLSLAPTAADAVAVLDWPLEAARRADLAAAGVPRLLVLADDASPPLVWDDTEDWIRVGADPAEVSARVTRLALLARPPAPLVPLTRPRTTAVPVLDADGILRGEGGALAVVPPIEARLLHCLLERPRHVVRRADLEAAGWQGRDPGPRALDGRMGRLRRRVARFEVHIRTVRGVGYLAEVGPV